MKNNKFKLDIKSAGFFYIKSGKNYEKSYAYLNGDQLSDILNDVKFKISINDDNLTMEEFESTKVDNSLMFRLIDDINNKEINIINGYNVLSNLKFNDDNGNLLYLSIKKEKPIEILRSLIYGVDDVSEQMKLSSMGKKVLNSLLEDDEFIVKNNKFKLDIKAAGFFHIKSGKSYDKSYAYLNGDQLSDILNDVKFKISINDDNLTIEEFESTKVDDSIMFGLIDDINNREINIIKGYNVLSNLKFNDDDGNLLYLSIKKEKPIKTLNPLIYEVDDVSEKMKLSSIGRTVLNSSLKDDESISDENSDLKNNEYDSYLKEQFLTLQENKRLKIINEIDLQNKEIEKYTNDILKLENKIKKSKNTLDELNKRLENFTKNEESNGFCFNISKLLSNNDFVIDDDFLNSCSILNEIGGLNNENIKNLIGGDKYYHIRIAKIDNLNDNPLIMTDEIFNKIKNMDIDGDFKINDDNTIKYYGKLNYHDLAVKFIKNGFERNVEFDNFCETEFSKMGGDVPEVTFI